MTTVMSVMNGFSDTMRDNLLRVEPHLVVIGGELGEIKRKIGSLGVDEIYPFEQQDIIVRTIDGEFRGAVAKGIEPNSLSQFLHRINPVDSNEYLSFFTKKANWPPGEILVGIELAKVLDLFKRDRVTFMPPESLLLPKGEIPIVENLVVGGLLSTRVQTLDRQTIIYNKNNSLRQFVNSASFERGFEIWLEDPDQAAEAKTLLREMGRIETWEERNGALLLALKLEKIAMSTLLSLGALITSFSIVTVLVLLLTQKKADIGLLMAMGLSRKKTQWVFMKIGMLLSTMGMGSGMVVGLVVSSFFAFTSFEILPSDLYHESSIPAQIQVISFVAVFIGSVIIAFLASWLPVRSHIDKSVSAILRDSL